MFDTLKAELFPDKNPIAPLNHRQIQNVRLICQLNIEYHRIKIIVFFQFEVLTRPTGDRMFLGAGAYGKVFKARDLDTGKLFALKEIDIQINFNSSGFGRPNDSGR